MDRGDRINQLTLASTMLLRQIATLKQRLGVVVGRIGVVESTSKRGATISSNLVSSNAADVSATKVSKKKEPPKSKNPKGKKIELSPTEQRVSFDDGCKFVDIGANLTDPRYQGVYRDKVVHAPDFDAVLQRSWNVGLEKIIVTGGSVIDCKKGLLLAKEHANLFCTVGCHPTNCNEFRDGGDGYLDELRAVITDGGKNIVAIGECGLDYARLHFCDKDVQLRHFEQQLVLSKEFHLPLFLHCRDSGDDLVDIMVRNKHLTVQGGVVHSFDGSWELAKKILDLGLHIGINGCSLRSEESLEVVRRIPLNRLLLETDAPWCEIRPTHPGFQYVKTKVEAKKEAKFEVGCSVKSRNEPMMIRQVLEVLAAVRDEDEKTLANAIYNNTMTLFFPT
eukprot:m.41552 g.41552  ORF g.41552 m.41552 type:complete len:392 (+) comp18852_c0_seq1:84-1259(+)